MNAIPESIVERLAQRLLRLARLSLEHEAVVVPSSSRVNTWNSAPAGRPIATMSSAENSVPTRRFNVPAVLAHEVVEGFPSVGVLDVTVLLDVDGDDAHAPMVEERSSSVDHDRKRREPGHGVVEEILPAEVLPCRRRNGREGNFASSRRSDGRDELAPREGLGQVVVGARLAST